MENKPMLTICTVTYNHEKYIGRALDSFLMQKTDFPFQVIVGDDASTDGTAEIIREYAKKYPDIIKPIFHKRNIGPMSNSLSVYDAARTEFVAICDGDDYWTDPLKLQKQVDMLRNAPDLSICYHPVIVSTLNRMWKDTIFPVPKYRWFKSYLTFDDLLIHNPIHTCSICFRWRFANGGIRDMMPDNICPGDYYLLLLHAEVGNVGFIDRVMATYRINSGGISFDLHLNPNKTWLKLGEMEMNWYRAFEKHFGAKYFPAMYENKKDKAKLIYKAYMNECAMDKLENMKNNYPEFYWLAKFNLDAQKSLSDNQVLRIKKWCRRIFFLSVLFGITSISLLVVMLLRIW
jgi:glycosyltransferase involved in cell wall biosynthesis